MRPTLGGPRRIVLAASPLMLVTLALAARADAFVYWANERQHDRRAPTSTAAASMRTSSGPTTRGASRSTANTSTGGTVTPPLPTRSGAPTSTAAASTSASPASARSASGSPVTWGRGQQLLHLFRGQRIRRSGGQTKSSLPASPAGTTSLRMPRRRQLRPIPGWRSTKTSSTGQTTARNDDRAVRHHQAAADRPCITGADRPTGVAVDDNFVYWANQSANTIGRATLDGTDVNQGFITGASFPSGVAVDDNYIYWGNADPLGRAAGRSGEPS